MKVEYSAHSIVFTGQGPSNAPVSSAKIKHFPAPLTVVAVASKLVTQAYVLSI